MANNSFTVDIATRWSDFDIYGHVNNVIYFRYLESARVKFQQSIGFNAFGKQFQNIVAKAECSYLKTIPMVEKVSVSLELSRFGRTSYDIKYKIHNGSDIVYATAKTVMVCFDSSLGKAVPVPEELKSFALDFGDTRSGPEHGPP